MPEVVGGITVAERVSGLPRVTGTTGNERLMVGVLTTSKVEVTAAWVGSITNLSEKPNGGGPPLS